MLVGCHCPRLPKSPPASPFCPLPHALGTKGLMMVSWGTSRGQPQGALPIDPCLSHTGCSACGPAPQAWINTATVETVWSNVKLLRWLKQRSSKADVDPGSRNRTGETRGRQIVRRLWPTVLQHNLTNSYGSKNDVMNVTALCSFRSRY